jgi:hypothetical protein
VRVALAACIGSVLHMQRRLFLYTRISGVSQGGCTPMQFFFASLLLLSVRCAAAGQQYDARHSIVDWDYTARLKVRVLC